MVWKFGVHVKESIMITLSEVLVENFILNVSGNPEPQNLPIREMRRENLLLVIS